MMGYILYGLSIAGVMAIFAHYSIKAILKYPIASFAIVVVLLLIVIPMMWGAGNKLLYICLAGGLCYIVTICLIAIHKMVEKGIEP